MPRGRNKKTPDATGETSNELVTSTATAVAEEPVIRSTFQEEPPFEPTGSYTPTEEELDRATRTTRGRFRSYVTDTSRGYSRLSDEEQRRIVLIFNEKPPADVLTSLKGGGFQYHPDYHGMKNAWTRRNDHEGRIQAEGIDTLVRSLIPGSASPER